MALDSGIHAGMTSILCLTGLVYNDERSSVGIHPATRQRCVTLARLMVFPAYGLHGRNSFDHPEKEKNVGKSHSSFFGFYVNKKVKT